MLINRNDIANHFNSVRRKLYLRWLYDKSKGLISSEYPQQYHIKIEDVRFIYTFHRCLGCGVWFFLNDGSLLDENGVIVEEWCHSDFI